jgi:hypothetical protein
MSVEEKFRQLLNILHQIMNHPAVKSSDNSLYKVKKLVRKMARELAEAFPNDERSIEMCVAEFHEKI